MSLGWTSSPSLNLEFEKVEKISDKPILIFCLKIRKSDSKLYQINQRLDFDLPLHIAKQSLQPIKLHEIT